MSWESYFWPDTAVLRNKLGLHDPSELEHAERQLVNERLADGAPTGVFDLTHLKSIHHHLFQDVYEWAGELRDVRMQKGASAFMPPDRIGMGMADVHRRLVEQNFLQGTDAETFARQAAQIIGDVNHVHPFREGNGRTQVIYMQQLGAQAGHDLLIEQLDQERWIEASVLANRGDYAAMQAEIGRVSVPTSSAPALEKARAPEPDQATVIERAQQELEARARAREAAFRKQSYDAAAELDRGWDRDRQR